MKKKITLFIMMLLCTGCATDSLQYTEDVTKISAEESEVTSTEHYEMNDTNIKVHICGEVYFPGVYTVYSESRIYEVVQQAGGFTKEADAEAVNQAKEVFDGEQIYIPSVKEREESTDNQRLIDINRANEELLCTIPGIGSQRAKQIIDYREKNGNFKKIEDLMKISGIKETLFEKIAPYITVS